MYVSMYVWVFFSFRKYTAQTTGPIRTHNTSKDAFRPKEVPFKQTFFSISSSWGSFTPKTPKFVPLVRDSQPKRKG